MKQEKELLELANKYGWEYISTTRKLSEAFIEKHADKVDWECISIHQKLSETFIEKHADKLNWEIIGSIGNDFRCFKIFNMKNFFVLLLNTLFYPFTMLYNILHRHSSTALFNPKALEVLSDPKKYEEMEKCINEYYKTGKWDYDKINQIIND
jgi:hypothetical protein